MRRNRWVALTFLAFVFFGAWIFPEISPYSYDEIHLLHKNGPPSSLFWWGSDELGRDVFTRCWWGARISLFVGVAAALLDGILGILYGGSCVLFGKKWDAVFLRFLDILSSIPYLLLVILLTVILGTGLSTILLAMTITGWVSMARMARGQFRQLLHMEYVQAAHSLGASKWHLLFWHLLPNAAGPLLANMTLTIPAAIFTEAFLSFVGLGVQAPQASWGGMLHDSLGALRYYPWRALFPALLLTMTMLSLHFVGNHLRNTLDPKTPT